MEVLLGNINVVLFPKYFFQEENLHAWCKTITFLASNSQLQNVRGTLKYYPFLPENISSLTIDVSLDTTKTICPLT